MADVHGNSSLYQCSFCRYETHGLELLLNHDCTYYQNTTVAATASANPTSFEFIPDTAPIVAPQGENVIEKLDRWGESEVRLLMTCYAEHKQLFGGKSTKKEVFNKIAESMSKTSNINVTGEQCMRKWGKLVTKLKEVNDHNSKSGNDRKSWKYFDELSLLVGINNPSINPECTMESSTVHITSSKRNNNSSSKDCNSSSSKDDTSSSIESSLCDDDTDVDSETEAGVSSKQDKTTKRSRKRPKSRSSASEMLEFMRNYTEKKEKIEEEKLHILKEMKEEKQAFLISFLR